MLTPKIPKAFNHYLYFLTSQGVYEFWGKTNMPKLIETEEFFRNKLEYIHNNPVKKQYAMQPEQWYWSS